MEPPPYPNSCLVTIENGGETLEKRTWKERTNIIYKQMRSSLAKEVVHPYP
jgi:hypothetical protein